MIGFGFSLISGIMLNMRELPNGLIELQASRLVSREVIRSEHGTVSDAVSAAGQFLLAAESADHEAQLRLRKLARAA